MQTLGISNSEVRSESRLKSLFWPSVQTGSDVDYLGSQGYWVCAIVAVFALVFSVLTGQPIIGAIGFLYYYFGGVGVREHSPFAAAAVFVLFALDAVMSPGVLRVLLAALLLSNLRATMIASSWKPESTEAAMPVRLGETWGDKFADKLPQWLWPKIRVAYYVYSVAVLMLALWGLYMMAHRRFG